MSFKVGDKVICIDGESWIMADTGCQIVGPKTDEITTISSIKPENGYLRFEEYQDIGYYASHHFRKLSEIEDLRAYKLNTTILEDLSAPIKIGKGLPQREELKELEKI